MSGAKKFHLKVEASRTVGELKREISERTGIDERSLMITRPNIGQLLDAQKTLCDYHILDGMELRVFMC